MEFMNESESDSMKVLLDEFGDELSDEDVLSMLEEMAELGLLDDDPEARKS